jgi:parallel beta-helix repeat protein
MLLKGWLLALLIFALVATLGFFQVNAFYVNKPNGSFSKIHSEAQSWVVFSNTSGTFAEDPNGNIQLSSNITGDVFNGLIRVAHNLIVQTGNYKVNSSLQVGSNTTIRGEHGSKLWFYGDSYLNLTGDNIHVEGLEIQGDGLNSPFGIRANGNCITIENCSVCNIGKVGTFGFGITLEYGSKHGIITNNIVRNTGLDGIHIRGNTNTVICGNKIVDSNDDGIASIFGNSNQIINNWIYRQGTINLAGNGIYTADKATIIESNYIENTPLNGIVADCFQSYQADGITIFNNTIRNAGSLLTGLQCSGILLNYACNTNVTGNTVDNSLNDGVRVFNGSGNEITKNLFENNICKNDSENVGVLLEYQSTYNTVSDNKITNFELMLVEAGNGVNYNIFEAKGISPDEIRLNGANSILLT